MKKLCILIMLTAFFISCGNGSPEQNENGGNGLPQEVDNYIFNQATHQSRKAAWENLGIDHYQFTVTEYNSSFGTNDSFTIIVAPGKESVVTTDIPEEKLIRRYPFYNENPFLYTHGKTITEIFAYIEQQVANLSPDREAIVFYNEEYHYPEKYFAAVTNPMVNGGGYIFEITAFENLRR